MPAELVEKQVSASTIDKKKKRKRDEEKAAECVEDVVDAEAKKLKKESKKKKKKDGEEKPKKKSKKQSDDSKEESHDAKEESIPQTEKIEKEEVENALNQFPLSESTKKSLLSRGIDRLFPIQAASFEHIMKGKDLVGRARTGTGKTLAFALPMVETLKKSGLSNKRGRSPRVLVMTPTRELASQVAKEFESISSGELSVLCIYGGVAYESQYQALTKGVDIVVGTPGRLIDHVERKTLKLNELKFVCLDEADQMLDIGFADNMDVILAQVKAQGSGDHQTLLFSATLPEWIKKAIGKYMKTDKITVDLIGNERLKTSDLVKHFAIPAHWQNRAQILGDIVTVYGRGKNGRTIIFVETKGEANELVLNDKLKDSQVIHGDIVQKQRETSMQGFREGKFRCLIATNVCARGVDIPEVDLVINCEPPSDVETYIHRSGRTGRAGKSGVCVTFYKPQQEYMIGLINKRAGVPFQRIGAPQPSDLIAAYAQDTVDQIESVHPKAMSYFTSTAQQILSFFKNDAQKSVEACLAIMASTTQPLAPRSLLTANEGFLTILFRVGQPIRNAGYVRAIVSRKCPGLTFEDTRGWRMTADEQGVVVDINSNKIEEKEEKGVSVVLLDGQPWIDERGVELEILKELPELKEFVQSSSNGPQRNGGQRQSNGYNRHGGQRQSNGYNRNGGQRQSNGQGRHFGNRQSFKK